MCAETANEQSSLRVLRCIRRQLQLGHLRWNEQRPHSVTRTEQAVDEHQAAFRHVRRSLAKQNLDEQPVSCGVGRDEDVWLSRRLPSLQARVRRPVGDRPHSRTLGDRRQESRRSGGRPIADNDEQAHGSNSPPSTPASPIPRSRTTSPPISNTARSLRNILNISLCPTPGSTCCAAAMGRSTRVGPATSTGEWLATTRARPVATPPVDYPWSWPWCCRWQIARQPVARRPESRCCLAHTSWR